jgi:hypothetical protein
MTVDMPQMASEARVQAAAFPAGSLQRRSWLCASVALANCATIPAARRALDDVGLDDVRAAATEILDKLIKERT